MPYETLVYHPLSFSAPPCALREPLRKPEDKHNQFGSENLGKKPTKIYYHMFFSHIVIKMFNNWTLNLIQSYKARFALTYILLNISISD